MTAKNEVPRYYVSNILLQLLAMVKEHGSFSPCTMRVAGGEVGPGGVMSKTILGG